MNATPNAKHRQKMNANDSLWGLLAGALLLGLGGTHGVHAQSYALSNLWSVAPGASTHPFLDTTHLTRGLAYNPATGHVLVASRTTAPAIYILNPTTGEVLGTLPYDGSLIGSGTFPINVLGVTDDGVIYVCNLTTDAASPAFQLYRWENETATPTLAYSGDPSGGNTLGTSPRRVGDSLAVRGTGANTQILLGSFNHLLFVFTTSDGVNFAAQAVVTDAAGSDTRWGLAWGAGNTFWAKQGTGNLKQFSLDLSAGTATTINSIAGISSVPGGPLDVDVNRKLLSLVDTTNHKLRLYDITDPAAPILQDTVKSFPGANANGNATGAVAVRNGKLFALESNNGLLAYALQEVNLPATIVTPPAAVTMWEGAAYWTFTVGVGGTPPFSYQWRFGGADLPGQTGSTLTVSNISLANQGLYSVVVSNAWGGATSSTAQMTVSPGNASAQVEALWNVLPGTRPYVTANPGYKEYGVAINPLTTNVLVLTRANPTNMLVALDMGTGALKHYIDISDLIIPSGQSMNRVDVADDGIVYIANLATAPNLTIYGIGNDSPSTFDKWVAFQGDPGNGLIGTTNQWGGTLAVRGSGLGTEILVGTTSAATKWVAILKPDANYSFTSTLITVTNAPAGFARLALAWGPGTNTFWAKNSSGNLILVEYDLVSQTGFVRKSYAQTGARSVPATVTGLGYDPVSGLLAGLLNGTAVRPVSVSVYDVSDLNAGPLWVDQELFTTYNPDIEYQGRVDFAAGYMVALGVNNGLKAFRVNAGLASLPTISAQPASGTWFRGTSPTLTVGVESASAVRYQWYYAGQVIVNATNAGMTISNIQPSQAGAYGVRVANLGGERWSVPAMIAVSEVSDTAQATNVWTLMAGSRSYLTSNYKGYGMAYNPVTTNLLLVNLDGSTKVAVLDALTGVEKHLLNVTPVAGGTKVLHKIKVADDGVVYAGNLTTAPGTNPYKLYRWSNDDAGTVPTVAYSGDPVAGLAGSKTVGVVFDVRGAGVGTEILLGVNVSNIVSLLTTTDGLTFTTNQIQVAGAPSGFCRLGIAFGEGNTFWAKTAWDKLYLVQYDLPSRAGTVLKSFDGTFIPGSVTAVAYRPGLKLLAGLDNSPQKNVRVYSAADLNAGLPLRDQELFPTYNASIEWNGELEFGGDYLFALDENNGVMAFRIDATYVPPANTFKILSVNATGGTVVLQWESRAGAFYQVQAADTVNGAWQNLGSPVSATGATATFTDTTPDTLRRFYRIQAQ